MRRLSLLLVLLALPAMGQGILYRPSGGQCGANMSCVAEDFTASANPGYACTNVGVCVNLGPGSCDNWSTNASGDILAGTEGVCTPTVRVGLTTIGNGTVSVNNGAIVVGTGSYLQVGGGSLVSGMLLVPVTINIDTIAASSCDDVTATVAGVEANDFVAVTPNFDTVSSDVSVSNARVTNAGTDEVTFRACNLDAGSPQDPANGSYLFWVVRKQ